MDMYPVEISLHVDDLSLWCCGATVEQLAQRAGASLEKLTRLLKQRGLTTSGDKEGLLATDIDSLQAVAGVLANIRGPRKVPHKWQATPAKLGIDYRFGDRAEAC
jgi:hypothetical protein